MRTGLRTLAVGLVLVTALAVGASVATAATSLSDSERATLLAMREEEKLAHDVYVALAAKTGEQAFLRIAASESRHTRALERVMAYYGIADPTDGYAAGAFPSAATQKLYDDLVARGSVSRAAAIGVGVTIEKADIADLQQAIAATDEALLDRVYGNLLAGSKRHLQAFEGNLTATATGCGQRAQAGERQGPGRAGMGARLRAGAPA